MDSNENKTSKSCQESVRRNEVIENKSDDLSEEFNSKIEILVELAQDDLRPFSLSDSYSNDHPGMQLEILPKIIFDTLDEDVEEDVLDLPKPIFHVTVDHSTQASVKHKSSKAQTDRRRLVSSWCQYEPRIFSEEEKETHLIDDKFQSFLSSVEKNISVSLTQNEIADSFCCELNSFSNGASISELRESPIQICGSFTSPEQTQKKKMISSIHWHSSFKDLFASSTITCISFEERMLDLLKQENDCVSLYIWSVKNQFCPKLVLHCYDDISILKFNPNHPNLIVGGTLNGQLVLWDIKDKLSREDGIEDTFYIVALKGSTNRKSSETSFQVASCGLDGFLQFWDIRLGFPFKTSSTVPKKYAHLDGVWEPFHSMQVMDSLDKKVKSLTRFSFRENTVKEEGFIQVPSDNSEKDASINQNDSYADFYGGCDDGRVFCCNFQLIKDENGKYIAKSPEFYKSPHNRAVSVLETSPFIKDIFLSAGGKAVAIWKHENKVRPLFLWERPSHITSGTWSANRPTLFFLGLENGSIEIWDLLLDIYEPTIVHYVSTFALKCLSLQKITEMEQIISAGDSSGIVYTMALPSSIWHPVANELQRIQEFIDKEEKRLNEMKTEVTVEKEALETKSSELFVCENEIEDEQMTKMYEAFLELQQQSLKSLGIEDGQEKQSYFM